MGDTAGQLAHRLHLLGLRQGRQRLPAFLDGGEDAAFQRLVERPQLLLGPLAMPHLALKLAGMLAQGILRGALLGDVGVDTNPFGNLAIRPDDRHRPDGKVSPHPVMPAHPVLEDEDGAGLHRRPPGCHAGSGILGMHGIGPAITLIGLPRLAGERGPAGLVPGHAAIGAVGPENAVHRIHSGAETLVAGGQLPLGLHPLRGLQHGAQDAARHAIGIVHRRIKQVEIDILRSTFRCSTMCWSR